MGVDLNDAGEQRIFGDTMPDGSFVHLGLKVKPGGGVLPSNSPLYSPRDNGFFRASTKSDAIMMDCEFTVLDGEHKGRKIFEFMTVFGGAVDDKGQSKGWLITKDRMRAIIDSCMGLDFKDTSPEAKAARQIDAFCDLDGIHFWAKLKVEPGNEITQDNGAGQLVPTGRFYPDKNLIERVVIPGNEEYAPLRAGQHVPPKPSSAKHVQTARPAPAAAAAPAPRAWGGGAAAAQPALPLAGAQTAAGQSTATASATGAPASAMPAASPSSGAAPKPRWMS